MAVKKYDWILRQTSILFWLVVLLINREIEPSGVQLCCMWKINLPANLGFSKGSVGFFSKHIDEIGCCYSVTLKSKSICP